MNHAFFSSASNAPQNRRTPCAPPTYSHSPSLAPVLGWVLRCVVGIVSNATETYIGPIADRLGGVDASVLTSAVAAGVVYLALVTIRPHAHAPRATEGGSL